MKTCCLFFFTVISFSAVAQEGKITVVKDTSIDHMLNLYQTFATSKRTVNGFRVQLASNNSRQELLKMKASFMKQFPEKYAYIEYAAPQFKLRVGDFKTHGEADQFLNEVRKTFSSAFIVPDKIVIEGVEW